MSTSRKQPRVVRAIQFAGPDKWERLQELAPGDELDRFHPGTNEDGSAFVDIDTPIGRMRAVYGDWISRGVNGEFFPHNVEPVTDEEIDRVRERVMKQTVESLRNDDLEAIRRICEPQNDVLEGMVWVPRGVPEDDAGSILVHAEAMATEIDRLGFQNRQLEEIVTSLDGELNAHRRYVEKIEHAIRMLAPNKDEIERYLQQVQEQVGLITREHPPGPPDPPIVPWRPKEIS